jgi:hypothetical protein
MIGPVRNIGPSETGAFQWVDPAFVRSHGNGRWRPSRRSVLVIAALGIVASACVAWLGYRTLSTPYNGWTISISNDCGYDVYATDAHDGIVIPADETIRWDHASKSLEKTIQLRSHEQTAGPVGNELTVKLTGNFVLSGSSCPAQP